MAVISFLLGAGFSVPWGYPIGDKVNDKISGFKSYEYDLKPDGTLIEGKLNNPPHPDIHILDRLQSLIEFYQIRVSNQFNYEEFYDYILSKDGKSYIKTNCNENDYVDIIDKIERKYNELIDLVIKPDKNKSGKNSFIEMIHKIVESGHVVNIHTLNHDLLLENMLDSNGIKYSDGFKLDISQMFTVSIPKKGKVQIPSFQDKYENNTLKLYKLHGSLDYYKVHGEDIIDLKPVGIVKTSTEGINISSFESLNSDGEIVPDITQYHPMFLTGRNSKLDRYKDYPFSLLLNHFGENLNHSQILIMIGYSGNDDGINDIIFKNFPQGNDMYVVSPSAKYENYPLFKDRNVKFIEKSGDCLTLLDIFPTCDRLDPQTGSIKTIIDFV